MSVNANKQAWLRGLQIAKQKIHFVLLRHLAEYGQELLDDAMFNREYTSFTGNTLTSLAFGIYENNALTDIVFVRTGKAPICAKIEKDKVVYLDDPYEGEARAVRGQVDIVDEYGDETSIRTLQSVCPKGGNGIVVTTGTEYSTYIENVRGLNVLSDTALEAENRALSEMRKWIKINTPIDKL